MRKYVGTKIIEAKENKSDMKLIKSSAYQSEYSALMEDFMEWLVKK